MATISDAGSLRVIQDALSDILYQRNTYADHLGCVNLETDEQGSVVSREKYYPGGGSAGSDEEQTEVPGRTRRHGGKDRDATGLFYYAWRYRQALSAINKLHQTSPDEAEYNMAVL